MERERRNYPDCSKYGDASCDLYVTSSPENFCSSTEVKHCWRSHLFFPDFLLLSFWCKNWDISSILSTSRFKESGDKTFHFPFKSSFCHAINFMQQRDVCRNVKCLGKLGNKKNKLKMVRWGPTGESWVKATWYKQWDAVCPFLYLIGTYLLKEKVGSGCSRI